MKIEWCETHLMSKYGEGLCLYGVELSRQSGLIADCRMVPMRLIPDNAIEIDWAASRVCLEYLDYRRTNRQWSADFDEWLIERNRLIALDGETP